jgi:hypothetical protein
MSEKELTISLNEPHEEQARVLREAKRFNVLDCGRRWGKSALAVNLLSEPAIEGYPTGYFTPTYKLLDGTYNECLIALEPIIKRKNEHQFIELITGGRIEFWSLENQLAGRSRKYKRSVVDEAAFVKNLWKLWTESIRATLSDLKGDAWFLSTPRGKNDFYKLFMRGKSNEPNWAAWQMSTYTNPYIDNDEINDAKADLPSLAFNQEYMAEFNENIANPFGSEHINKCTKPLSALPAEYYGIDLAKSVDWTVIIGLDKNGDVCFFDRFQRDWLQTKEAIQRIPKNKPVVIDSTGVGDAIVEDVQKKFNAMHGFKYTTTSKQQLMESLASSIHKGEIGFPAGPIKDELEIFEYLFTPTGVRYSAPSGFHDDCVNALAMANKCRIEHKGYGQYYIL